MSSPASFSSVRSGRLSRLAGCAGSAALFVAAANCSSSSSTPNASTSAVIGPLGGSLKSADGVLEVILPAGAESANTTVTITSQTNPPAGAIGTAYTVQPFTPELLLPATILINYGSVALGGVDPATVQAALYNGAWQELANQDNATSTKIVTGTSIDFSLFGLVGPSTAVPPSTDGGAPVNAGDGGATSATCSGTLTPSVGLSPCSINETCADGHVYAVSCDPSSNFTCKCTKDGTAVNTTSVTSCDTLEATTLATCGFPVGTIKSSTTSDGGSSCTFTLFPATDAGPDGGASCSVSEVCGNADRYQIVCDATTGACQCSDNGVPAGTLPTVSCDSMTTSSITKCFYPGP